MPVQCITCKRTTVVLDPGVSCGSTSAIWVRSSHRGRGGRRLNRTRSTESAAARRTYRTFTRFVSASRRWLHADTDSVGASKGFKERREALFQPRDFALLGNYQAICLRYDGVQHPFLTRP